MDVLEFIEKKINHFGEMIATQRDKADELAMGELLFYLSLRRVLKNQKTPQDIGMMDAVNDVLQFKGLVAEGKKFYE
jgi:hypothetical protein